MKSGRQNDNRELDRFKSEINLTEYAAHLNYTVDRKESTKSTTMMRNPNGDKIAITHGQKGWVYFSVRDEADNGTIIDFVKNRELSGTGSLGEIRKKLRQWIGEKSPTVSVNDYVQDSPKVIKDRVAVKEAYSNMLPIYNTSYLNSRGIRDETIDDPRFKGMIRQDERKNVVFPHHDKEGLSGFELKNFKFTGFAKGGDKALWYSRSGRDDDRLVLAESAIDALSYHQIKGTPQTRYMSIAGQLNENQKNLLLPSAMTKMKSGSVVVTAFDNDSTGEKYHETIKKIAPSHVTVVRDAPKNLKDWNDQLKEVEKDFIRQHEKRVAVIAFAKGLDEKTRSQFLEKTNERLSEKKSDIER